MAIPRHQFIVDDSGKKKAVIVDLAEYQRLIEEAEELESILAYDAAKAADDEAIPFEQAITEIEDSPCVQDYSVGKCSPQWSASRRY